MGVGALAEEDGLVGLGVVAGGVPSSHAATATIRRTNSDLMIPMGTTLIPLLNLNPLV